MASWSERRQQWVDSREEARNNASQAAADSGEQRPPNAWPFIIAAGIVVVLLVGIFAASKFAPAEDNVTQAQLLTDAVDGFLEAQNSGDADLLRENTCFDQVAVLALVQREAGGNTAEVLDQVTANIRARMDVRRLVKVLTAQGKFSSVVVALIPIGIFVFIMLD